MMRPIAESEDEDSFGKYIDTVLKKGEFNIILRQYSASRWSWSVVNPQGGSFGMNGYPNVKAAQAVAITKGFGKPGPNNAHYWGHKKANVIVAKWDPNESEYQVVKSYPVDLPQDPAKGESRQHLFTSEQLAEMRCELEDMTAIRGLAEDLEVDDDIESVFNDLRGQYSDFDDQSKMRAKKLAIEIIEGHDLWRAIYNQAKLQASKTFDLGDAHSIAMAIMEIIYSRVVGVDEGETGTAPPPESLGDPGDVDVDLSKPKAQRPRRGGAPKPTGLVQPGTSGPTGGGGGATKRRPR